MTLFQHQPSENLFKMFDVVKYVNDIQLLGDKKLHELVKTLQSAAFESARSAVFFMKITYLYFFLPKDELLCRLPLYLIPADLLYL